MSTVAPKDTDIARADRGGPADPNPHASMDAARADIMAAGGWKASGPGAFEGSLRRMANLTWTLGFLDFRLKFFGSILGYFWQLARPVMQFGIYFVLFTQIIPVSKDTPYFAPLLLFGIMIYQYFGDVTGSAVTAVLTREGLVRKIHFPRIVIPFSVIVTATLNLMVNMVAVVAFMAIYGVPARASAIEIVPVLVLLLVFLAGLAMLLSALYVRYRDIAPIWEITSLGAFYATPILYPLEKIESETLQQIIMCNPLAVVQEQIRHSVFDPAAPSAAEAIGGWPMMLIPIGLTVGIFVAGLLTYKRLAPSVAEDL
jgi:ABC-2 type transport system permease protein